MQLWVIGQNKTNKNKNNFINSLYMTITSMITIKWYYYGTNIYIDDPNYKSSVNGRFLPQYKRLWDDRSNKAHIYWLTISMLQGTCRVRSLRARVVVVESTYIITIYQKKILDYCTWVHTSYLDHWSQPCGEASWTNINPFLNKIYNIRVGVNRAGVLEIPRFSHLTLVTYCRSQSFWLLVLKIEMKV